MVLPVARRPARVIRSNSTDYYGGPEVLHYGDLPDPVAARGEVVIGVHAASVNAADWKVRAGQYAQAEFPLILGRVFSGVIGAIGEDVADLKVGDAVGEAVGISSAAPRHDNKEMGSYAQTCQRTWKTSLPLKWRDSLSRWARTPRLHPVRASFNATDRG